MENCKKLSSSSTAFWKKVFPALWFGFLALFLVLALTRGAVVNGSVMFLIVPCVMVVMGYLLFRNLLWNLVDEVYDCGDFLLIKNRGQEHRVPLTDIMNVDAPTTVRPPRITLRLKNLSAAGSLGSEVSFSPRTQQLNPFNPFAKNPIAEDLIQRVDQARSRRLI
jgi:hypothetical protein